MHREIVERLEKSKALGLISDYFVSWIGVHGKLAPVVRAWRNPHMSAIRIREQVGSSLAGTDRALVPSARYHTLAAMPPIISNYPPD